MAVRSIGLRSHQLIDDPLPGWPGRLHPTISDVKRQAARALMQFGQIELHQLRVAQVILNDAARHESPSQSRTQHRVLRTEVGGEDTIHTENREFALCGALAVTGQHDLRMVLHLVIREFVWRDSS